MSLVLVGGVEYAKLEGNAGVFTTIEFPNEECSLSGQKFIIAGSVLVKDCKGEFSKELFSHLIEEDMAATLNQLLGLTFGANSASVDGSSILQVDQLGIFKTFAGLA